jgi:hypothetical protein
MSGLQFAYCFLSHETNVSYVQVSYIKILPYHPSLLERLWLSMQGKKRYACCSLFIPYSYKTQTRALQMSLERWLPLISVQECSVTAV